MNRMMQSNLTNKFRSSKSISNETEWLRIQSAMMMLLLMKNLNQDFLQNTTWTHSLQKILTRVTYGVDLKWKMRRDKKFFALYELLQYLCDQNLKHFRMSAHATNSMNAPLFLHCLIVHGPPSDINRSILSALFNVQVKYVLSPTTA